MVPPKRKQEMRPVEAETTNEPALKLACIFFKTDRGNEPVRKWLKEDVPAEARKTIGSDIKTVQATWPIGKPLIDSLGHGLWEVRSTHDKVEYRVIFVLDGSTMVLLHGCTKGSTKTRKADIAVALERKAIRERSR
jgi:phage-related protein